MKIIAGVDGGATRTRVALADASGRILGIGVSGPSNYGSVPKLKIRNHIEEAYEEAINQSGIAPKKLAALFLGMAGVISTADREAIRDTIKESELLHPAKIYVDHDIRISLAGGLTGKEGIALLVGTGSSCYGCTNDGSDWMAGGWEYLLDDRGSAYDLARRGLTAVVRAADGRGPKTDLTDVLMRQLNITHIQEIIGKVYSGGKTGRPMDKKEIASLASLITNTAQLGDQVALKIVREGISELTLMIKTVYGHLNFSSTKIPLVISGGTINGSQLMKNELFEKLESSVPEIEITEPILKPITGSVLLALQSIGIDTDDSIIENLKKSEISCLNQVLSNT